MKRIKLTQGKYAMVDDSDYNYLMQWKWYASGHHGKFYARRGTHSIRMHRVILPPGKGFEIDHIDRNGLNNQRNNLRLCTRAQNQANVGLSKNNKSGFKGVYWLKASNKWAAEIKVNRKNILIGQYFCIVKAAKAYDAAAEEYFGEFAYTNFNR